MLAAPSTVLFGRGWYLLSTVAVATVIVACRIKGALAVALLVGVVFLAGDAAARSDNVESFHQVHDASRV